MRAAQKGHKVVAVTLLEYSALVSNQYHRLDVEFDQAEPRLDDAKSMSELKSKVQADDSLSKAIDRIARCTVASLFYFELESIPD
jgi:hypothetical protein